MPDRSFSVHLDPDDLALRNLGATLSPTGRAGKGSKPGTGGAAAHHGADDSRLAARQRSERDRAGRASGGSGRSYAFRRS
jgi:hypothetical protein